VRYIATFKPGEMKKIVWYCSLAVIFFNTIIAMAITDYPVINNTLINFSALAVLFMVYVVLFEKKTSTILRNTSVIFGLAGLTKIIFDVIALHSFVANAILLGVTTSTLLVVFLPVFIEVFIHEKD
jgi:hypothetical protein